MIGVGIGVGVGVYCCVGTGDCYAGRVDSGADDVGGVGVWRCAEVVVACYCYVGVDSCAGVGSCVASGCYICVDAFVCVGVGCSCCVDMYVGGDFGVGVWCWCCFLVGVPAVVFACMVAFVLPLALAVA